MNHCDTQYQNFASQSINYAYTRPGDMTSLQQCIKQRSECIAGMMTNQNPFEGDVKTVPEAFPSPLPMSAMPDANPTPKPNPNPNPVPSKLDEALVACGRIIEDDINGKNIAPEDSKLCLEFISEIQTAFKQFEKLKCSDAKKYVDENPQLKEAIPQIIQSVPIINTGLKGVQVVASALQKSSMLYNCLIDEMNKKYDAKIPHIKSDMFDEKQSMMKQVFIYVAIIVLTIFVCYFLFK